MNERPFDMKYFQMFDSDSSLEVTFDEFCVGMRKHNYPAFMFGDDWFGKAIADYKTGSDESDA
jgi:hypothetical protein